MRRLGRLLLPAMGAIMACGSPGPEHVRMPASGTMMAGDSMTLMAPPLIPAALARLDSLESADPAARAASLSHHAEALSPLLKAIQTDLMHMGMHRDSAYEALVDSVRRDAAALVVGSTAPPESLGAAAERFRRMLSAYGGMVAKGKRG